MTKRIVLVNQDSGYLSIDIANAFAKVYDEVVLMTGYLVAMDSGLSENIKVHDLYKYNRKNIRTRAVSWIIATMQVLINILFRYRKYEIFFSTNPPTVVFLLPLIKQRNFSLLVLDLYPDAIVMGNFTKSNSPIFRFWSMMNRKYLIYARSIVTLTNGMASSLAKYVDRKKINVIPAWSSGFTLPDYSDSNPFIRKYGLENKFIIMYSGNMGKDHEVEALIDLADFIRNDQEIMIVIAGQGWKYNFLGEEIKKRKLENCKLLPKQSVELFFAALAATNVGVVSLSQAAANVSIPSKTFNLLGAGKPILCIGSEDSDLSRLLKESKTGAAFFAEHIQRMSEFIIKIKEDKELYKQFSNNALLEARNYTAANADRIVKSHLHE